MCAKLRATVLILLTFVVSGSGQTPQTPVIPKIEAVFPTTTYPQQNRFSFDIIGEHFSPDPANDSLDVDGQGPIEFVSRHSVPPTLTPANAPVVAAATPTVCKAEPAANMPCLEASSDGRRLVVYGFPRRSAYQGPMRVRVRVKDSASGQETASEFSGYFILSRVNHRIVVALTIVFFGLLMYIVYLLVSRGVQDYVIAGVKFSPLASFLLDKDTNTYSLSKFQLLSLSMVSFFAYVYVFLCRALVQWQFTLPDIPDNYPSLLAISAGTTVVAAGLNKTIGSKGAGPVMPSAADFITNGGLVVVERFQFFVWTIIACVSFLALILMQDPATLTQFPVLPSGLLYVMGVSATGYLAGKAVRNPGPNLKAVAVSAQNQDLKVTLTGENLDKQATFRIDGALQQTTTAGVAGQPQPQAPQDYCTQLDFVLVAAASFATDDHTFEITNGDGIGAQLPFTGTPMRIVAADPVAHSGGDAPVNLQVTNYRAGCSAKWLAPGSTTPVDIASAKVSKIDPAVGNRNVKVQLTPGNQAGTGTLTLIAPRGGTEATSITVT